MDKTVTIEQVLDWGPCYTLEQVEDLFDDRDLLGWRDIAALPISAEHRCWALLHDEFFDVRQLYLIGADIAELVLPNYEYQYPNDPRPRLAIEAARQFARGEIDENQLEDARSAACDAVCETINTDPWSAATLSAFVAACDSAWSAAWYIAKEADSDADRSASWGKSLQIICRYLEG